MSLLVCGSTGSVPVATGTVDYLPYLHGQTPGSYIFNGDVKAALFFSSAATANSTITAPAQFMWGMTDGTNHARLMVSGNDGVTTTDWRTYLDNSGAVGHLSASADTKIVAATASILTNGIRLTYGTVAGGYKVNALVFGGSGVEAQVVNTSFVGGGPETKTVTHSLSGPPDLIRVMIAGATVNTFTGQGRYSTGWYVRSANGYIGIGGTHLDGQVAENIAQVMSTAFAAAEVNNAAAVNYSITLGNFTATTLDLLTSADALTDGVSLLLLKIPNFSGKAGIIDLPANSTEFAAVSGLTSRPKFIFSEPSILTGASSTGDNAGWFGFGAAWENNGYPEQFSGGCLSDDGASTTNNKSMTSGLFLQVPTLSGTPVTQSLMHLSSFKDDGVNAAMSTPDTVIRKLGYVIGGDSIPAPIVTSVSSLTPGQPFTITGTGFAASSTAVINGVSQPLTGQSSTQLTGTALLGSNRYLSDVPVVVTANGQSSAAVTVQFNLEAGLSMVNGVAPLIVDTDRVSATPDAAGGDQLVWNDLTVSVTNDFTVNTTNSTSRDFQVRLHDGVDWSATPVQSTWATLHLDITIPVITVIMPDITGLNVTDATAALVAANLALGNKTSDYSATVAADLVFAQSPIAGSVVAKGSGVDIEISLGPRPLAPVPILKSRPKTTGLRKFLLG